MMSSKFNSKTALTVAFLLVRTGLSAGTRPNIILIVADDHGKDALRCYGNPVIETPNLDALASDGVRFSHAYCTSASSSASRAVILTGKYGHSIAHYGHEHTYHHFSTDSSVKSLPLYLSEAGYKTVRIGKFHVAPEKVYHFDEVLPCNARSTVEMANKCQAVFQSEAPFFLYFCTDDPHRDASYIDDNYRPNSFGNKTEGYPSVNDCHYDPNKVIIPPFISDTPESRAEIAQYYRSVHRLDQGIGRLIDYLKASGKYDNTLIVYISDNGMAFPGAKTSLYEPGCQLPCIVKEPFTKSRNKVSDSPVSWVDLTPTLLDYAGITEKVFAGKSFRQAIEQPEIIFQKPVFGAHTFHEVTMYYPMRMIIDGKFKLIVNFAHYLPYPFASDLWFSPTFQAVAKKATSEKRRAALSVTEHSEGAKEFMDKNSVQLIFDDVAKSNILYGKRKIKYFIYRTRLELYNLDTDPDEIHNLAYRRKYIHLRDSLTGKIKTIQKETNDPWFSKWEYE